MAKSNIGKTNNRQKFNNNNINKSQKGWKQQQPHDKANNNDYYEGKDFQHFFQAAFSNIAKFYLGKIYSNSCVIH